MLRNLQAVFAGIGVLFWGYSLFAEPIEERILGPIEVRAKKGTSKSVEVTESGAQTLEVNPQFHRSLIQVFQSSPSILAQESGVQSSPHLILRGQDPQQSRYFLEGVPLTDSQFNADVVSLLPFQAVARMDVYPDGVPVGLASDGLGGGVDFHLWEHVQSVAGVKTGSFGFGELFAKTSLGNPRRHLTFNVIRSDENFKYYDDGGTPLNANSGQIIERDHNKYFRVGVIPLIPIVSTQTNEWKYFGINSIRNIQIPGPVSLPMNGELTQMFHLSAVSGESWLSGELKNKSLFYAKIDSQKYRTDKKTKSLSSVGSNDSLEETLGLRNYIQWYRFYPMRFEQTLGVNYERYDFKSLAVLSSSNPSPELNQRWDLPLSLASYIPVKDWEIKPAFMAQAFWYQGKTETHYVLLSPRVGLSLDKLFGIEQLRFESSLGKFYRAPSMIELNGNSFGISPSRELLPEKADKVSVGIGLERTYVESWISRFKVSYAYSLAASKNLIAYIQNSQNSQIATNIGESLIQSHEGQVEFEIFKKIVSNSSITLLETENLSELPSYYGKKIPNRPGCRWGEKLGYQSSALGISYQLQWIGERFLDLANTKKLGSVAEHGINVSYRTHAWGDWNLELLNLLDTVTAGSYLLGFQTLDNTTGYLGYPSPGRRIYLSWQYEL